MPFLLVLKPILDWLKALPWQIYAAIALCALLFFARLHWIGVGVDQCEAKQAKAQERAIAKSITQAMDAPKIAQKAIDDVKPQIETRIKVIRESIPVNSCPDYPTSVQAIIRESASAAD